jgi:hypothetical protein
MAKECRRRCELTGSVKPARSDARRRAPLTVPAGQQRLPIDARTPLEEHIRGAKDPPVITQSRAQGRAAGDLAAIAALAARDADQRTFGVEITHPQRVRL